MISSIQGELGKIPPRSCRALCGPIRPDNTADLDWAAGDSSLSRRHLSMLSSKRSSPSVQVRYGIALVSVAIALTTVLFLQRLQVRTPFALIFLAAIAL